MTCPRCQTEMVVKGGYPDFEGDLEGQTMYYACPVCQGTPEEFDDETARTDLAGYLKLIAARDAAIRDKALEDAAKAVQEFTALQPWVLNLVADAIRALKNKEEENG